ncbi:MAG: permease prefix domain 1-containing protein, partial [Blastocatellia bacterium]
MPEWKQEIRQRLVGLRLAPAREAEIVEELSQRLEDYYAESLARGATPEEASRAALAELRDSELLAKELQQVERAVSQEPIVLGANRRNNMIAGLWQDLRYGARMLAKAPGFTLLAVVTLALGIGANTAVFSVVNAVLLRPLAYREPERLVALWGANPERKVLNRPLSTPDFDDWRAQNRVFEALAAYPAVDMTGMT